LTTMVSRDDLEDQLRILIPNKSQLPRLMKLIDAYVVTMAHKLEPTNWHPDKWAYLKPGDTDSRAEGGVRRCIECAKVKKLHKHFTWDRRYPHNRLLRCTACLPPKPSKHGERTGYKCKKCKRVDLPVTAFPKAKALNPHLTFYCLDCKPIAETIV
jgi:hypothetical protein